jgi:hypothetical protein
MAVSVLGRSCRSPASASAWRIQLRSALVITFICSARRGSPASAPPRDTGAQRAGEARRDISSVLPRMLTPHDQSIMFEKARRVRRAARPEHARTLALVVTVPLLLAVLSEGLPKLNYPDVPARRN